MIVLLSQPVGPVLLLLDEVDYLLSFLMQLK